MLKFLRGLVAGDIVGIDLGTTNSVIAALDGQNRPVVIPNNSGKGLTPSTVAWSKEGQILVGDVAVRQGPLNPVKTIYSSKRFIGRDFDDVKSIWQAYPFIARPGYDKQGVGFEIDGRIVTPQEVAAHVLKSLKADAEAYLGRTISKAVVTVPAYFNDRQRQATKDAAAIAGLEVQTINEPTAAALAFADSIEGNQTILVFDLGGGTFDVSILKIEENDITVLATGGDNYLGGDNFDELLMGVILRDFTLKNGVDLSKSPESIAIIKKAVVDAKIELSTAQSTEINLPFVANGPSGPLHLTHKLTRSDFENLIRPLAEKAIAHVKETVERAGLKPSSLDNILLVGGSTRIPLVQRLVQEYYGKAPLKNHHTDEIVAMGAAIFGGIQKGSVDMELHDVVSMSLGVQVHPDKMKVLIKKDTNLGKDGITATDRFTTVEDNQIAARISTYQGESPVASDNNLLGYVDLEGIEPMPKGKPTITVTYHIDLEGLLHVSAVDEKGNEQKVTLHNAGKLEKREVRRMAKEASLPDSERKLLQEKRQELSKAIKEFEEKAGSDQKMMIKVEEAEKVLQEEISTKELTKAIAEITD